MKGLRVTKIVKKLNFEGVWGKLESERGFQGHRKSVAGYLGLALAFVWNGAV